MSTTDESTTDLHTRIPFACNNDHLKYVWSFMFLSKQFDKSKWVPERGGVWGDDLIILCYFAFSRAAPILAKRFFFFFGKGDDACAFCFKSLIIESYKILNWDHFLENYKSQGEVDLGRCAGSCTIPTGVQCKQCVQTRYCLKSNMTIHLESMKMRCFGILMN